VVDEEEAKDALEQDVALHQVAVTMQLLEADKFMSPQNLQKQLYCFLQCHKKWKRRKSMELKVMVFALKCNFAVSTDVLVLYTIFIIKTTADSVKLYITKTVSMMTDKKECLVFAT
jgi:hypothetical protein